jgi:hypothetical protein
MSKIEIKAYELQKKKEFLNSEYFFENKPDVKNKLPIIQFEKVLGRVSNNESHCKIDGTIETLFPEFLSSNKKLY